MFRRPFTSTLRVMQTTRVDPLQAILDAYRFEGWASRRGGRRLRCPHGLLIRPDEECPVGCVSPLVVMGLLDLLPADLAEPS